MYASTDSRTPRRSSAPSEATPNVKVVFVNELKDGAEIDQVLLVREVERRQRRDGGDYLRLRLGDRTGAVVSMVWEELGEIEELARGGRSRCTCAAATPSIPASDRRSTCAGSSAPAPGSYSPDDLLDGPRARRGADGGASCASCSQTVQQPAPARAAGAAVRRGLRAVERLPHRARRQVLPPGLPSRAARALPRRRPGGQRDSAPRSPASTATSRSRARCCTTSASSRPTPRTRRRDRPHRRRAAAGRDRARLLPRPPRDRGDRRLPRRAGAGGAPHHPLPPRLARARQPGRALHARGDARAHDRQPRRAAGQLRPPREGARSGPPLVRFDRALDGSAFFAGSARTTRATPICRMRSRTCRRVSSRSKSRAKLRATREPSRRPQTRRPAKPPDCASGASSSRRPRVSFLAKIRK